MRSFKAVRKEQEVIITYDRKIIFIKGLTFFQKLDVNLNLNLKWIIDKGNIIGFKYKKSKYTSMTSDLLIFKRQLDGLVMYTNFEQLYCINSVLGYGGCSEAVFKVTSYLDKKQYAAKKISKGFDKESTFKEISILNSIDHPNIVKMIEVYFYHEEIYIVMERLYHLKNVQKSEEQLRTISLQILRGLYYIHSQGLIHRDLKKSNIMITSNGDIKIIDFGLCAYKNQARHKCGTIGYMAPEVLRSEQYDERCDLFSLACVMFEMFYDKYLFDGINTNEVRQKNQECTINFQALPELSQILTDLLENLLCDQGNRLTSEQALEHEFFDQQFGISKFENLQTKSSPL